MCFSDIIYVVLNNRLVDIINDDILKKIEDAGLSEEFRTGVAEVLSRLDFNNPVLSEREYDVRNLIPPVIKDVRSFADKKSIVFSYNIDGSVPRCLFGDDKRLSHIFCRLLKASARHLQGGRVAFEVSAEKSGYATTLILMYTDLTQGFDENDLNGLQMYIETGDESYLDGTKLVGMGYRTVSRLTHQLYGSLKFEIVSDTETQFVIKIPQLEVEVAELGS